MYKRQHTHTHTHTHTLCTTTKEVSPTGINAFYDDEKPIKSKLASVMPKTTITTTATLTTTTTIAMTTTALMITDDEDEDDDNVFTIIKAAGPSYGSTKSD